MGNIYFAKRIRQLREKKGYSMNQLARELNITKSRINMWENNGTIPRMDVLINIANFFNVTTDYLLGNENDIELSTDNQKLRSLQRNLSKLNDKELQQAEGMLKAVFFEIFNDTDEEDDFE